MNQFIGKGTISLFSLLGAVVLLLWGVRMVRKGLEQVLIPHANASSPIFSNRFLALISGMGGAALLQSSTALVLIISSVATKVAIPLSIGLAFVLGADVGTALAAQIFVLNIKSIGPLLLFIGFFIQRTAHKEQRRHQAGQVLMGFGFVLYGLSSIGSISGVIQESGLFSSLLSSVFINDIALAILIAILFTWLSHSSLAMVLITLELVTHLAIPIDLGVSLVLGANIGACLPAYIDSVGLPVEARRLTFGNVIFRVFGGILVLPFIGAIINLSTKVNLSSSQYLMLFHLLFNGTLALLFIFFTKPIGNLIVRILPEPVRLSYKGVQTKFLRTEDITNPTIAILNLKKEVHRMSDNMYAMINQIAVSLYNVSEVKSITRLEQDIDALYRSVSKYLQKLYALELTDEQIFDCMFIHSYCTDLEQAADILSNNFLETIKNKHKKSISISKEYQQQVESMFSFLKENMNLSQELFRSAHTETAQELVQNKENFKNTTLQLSQNHKTLLLRGNTDSININAIYLDIINDLRRVNSHITALAYPVIDKTGYMLDESPSH